MVKLFLKNTKIAAYVHYPFISSDMVRRVEVKDNKFNNSKRIADSKILSTLKIYYYKLLLWFYSKMGELCSLVFTNSSWTNNHIKESWKYKDNWMGLSSTILYPPCNTKHLVEY